MVLIKNNRYVFITISIVAIIAIIATIIAVFNYKTPIQRKLVGFWNIEFENSAWDRDSIYNIDAGFYVQSKDTIKLPFVFGSNKPYFISKAEATGTWEIISKNPDSVFFNVPKNPLHGKYAIRFFIDRNGYLNMKNNIYKMELSNDSTRLICNKGGVMYMNSVRDWEGKN